MNLILVARLVVTLLFFLSSSFLIPFFYSIYVHDGYAMSFVYPVILVSSLFILVLQLKPKRAEPNLKEAILTVVLVWFLFPAISAMCYIMSGAIPSFPDAYFESVSGFTTTGSSILTNIEALPKSILLWRSTTNWVGGIGFVVFSLSVLPALGTGGAQLMRFEASKALEEKILPRAEEIARAILIVYLSLTFSEVLLLKIAGMDLFDAVNHSFCTIATGGLSTKNGSVGEFHSFAVEMIIAIFMIAGSITLPLYYKTFKDRSLREFFDYYEVKYYLIMLSSATAVTVVILLLSGTYKSIIEAFRYGFFQVVTTGSTTGFSSTDYTHWPSAVLALFMILELIGGCSGSTSGGLKQFRFIVMLKTSLKEIRKTAHPNLVYRVNLGNKVLDVSILNAIWAFVSVYAALTVIVGFLLTLTGNDLVTAFSASIACMSNSGPGLALVGPAGNFHFLQGWEKLLLSLEMILGRLEILSVLTVFTPYFWKD